MSNQRENQGTRKLGPLSGDCISITESHTRCCVYLPILTVQKGRELASATHSRLDVTGQPGLVIGITAHSRGLKVDEHCGPFQPRIFYDSMIL